MNKRVGWKIYKAFAGATLGSYCPYHEHQIDKAHKVTKRDRFGKPRSRKHL
jgi:hypothetical protein